MSHIKNPNAYFCTVVKNLDKNDFRANDNFYNYIDSIGDEFDIRGKINQQTKRKPDAYSVECLLCDSNVENWLLLMENQRLHMALSSLVEADVEFLLTLSKFNLN